MDEIYFWFNLEEIQQEPKLDPSIIVKQLKANNLKFLGSGGFGETWACDINNETYAIKIIHNPALSKTRISKEVEGLKRSSGPHLVKFFDFGYLRYNKRKLPFIQFEFIKGGNLRNHISSGNWPNFQEIIGLTKGILRGLNQLHTAGVIHRDLKPENVILRDGIFDQPVIVDLGLVKIIDTSEYTRYPSRMGTRPYMAPEQIMGERPKKSTDLWALGVMLFILLTKRHPFYGDIDERLDSESALDRIYSGIPPLPNGIPDILKELTERFLSPEPYQRGSARRALRDLEEGGAI